MATNPAPFPTTGESPYGDKVQDYIDAGDDAVEAAAKADAAEKYTKKLGTSYAGDLNAATVSGHYIVTYTATMVADRNAPVNQGGWLEVITVSANNILQRYTVAHSTSPDVVFHRTTTNGGTSWTPWGEVTEKHVSESDPHPQYETSAEAAAKITAHEAAPNPHPQYLLTENVWSLKGLPVNDVSNRHPFFYQDASNWTAANFTDFFGFAPSPSPNIYPYIELQTSGVTRLMGILTNGRATTTPGGGWHVRGHYDELVRMKHAGLDLIGVVISNTDIIWDWADIAARVPENSGFNITAKTEYLRYSADPSASMTEVAPMRVGYPTAVKTPADLAPWAPLGDWEFFIPSNYPPIGVGIYVASLGRMAYKTAPGVFKDSAGTQVYPAVADVSPLDRVRYGTGNPNGVHAAPVGSVFRNTEAGGWNGARVWRKDTGTGTTGWVVESGDTGLREDNSMLPEDVVYSTARIVIRRVGAQVTLSLDSLILSEAVAGGADFLLVPSGFAPNPIARFNGSYNISNNLYFAGRALRSSGNIPTGDRRAYFLYTTDDAWPSTLPGTPA